ncbi:hypothetical protein HDIA_4525 [Hartmannibacter diazotrophicus]|uniref:Uncharacterized protein n=1 Tax=Hartmannibacter diazotrophicus TaxID=1482074 RepID=A0A2C9DCT1_9HYPH|nr:transglutaminase-like cysteine peptidase [Hartmannibacter diazotrophicus]SON58066.1 hypothetical protein HDIA_4525 [Hartmannibacter diazotrophicus]
MFRFLRLAIAALLLGGVLPVQTASAIEGFGAPRILAGRPTLAPFGYVRFCHKNPDDCRGGKATAIASDAASLARLGEVNRTINRTIRPRNDKGDVWSADVASGDCEDYALSKRRALVHAGFPAAALRIAVAVTPSGEGHAVLVVRTAKGDMVLDNRFDTILSWSRTDLTWKKIASSENPLVWRSI